MSESPQAGAPASPPAESDRARREVDAILTQRAAAPAGRRAGLVVSVLLHGVLAAAALVIPALAERNRPPLEFNSVTIVPVQALGDPTPTPQPQPRQEPEPRKEPEPEPEPEVDEPEEASEPERLVEPRPAPTAAPPPPERRPAATPPPAPPRQRQGSAFGSSTGTSPFGSSAVGIDHPDFTYNYYVDQMLARLGSYWVRPRVRQGIEAIVRFRIARDGTVSDVELLRESGVPSFDHAALRVVRLASPLPRLPASFPDDSLTVNLVVR